MRRVMPGHMRSTCVMPMLTEGSKIAKAITYRFPAVVIEGRAHHTIRALSNDLFDCVAVGFPIFCEEVLRLHLVVRLALNAI